MKTKNLLFLILLLGLSFNTFSQEEVTIKQVIKNSSSSNIKGTNDQISIVEINTSIPVTINKGEENAIFIKGNFNNAEDYIGLCTLDNGLLKINNPKKGKEITLELASDVIVYHFKNANVVVNRDVSVNVSNGMIEADNGIIEVDSNSSAKFNGKVNGNYLYIRSKNNSRLSFASIEALELDVNVGKESEVILKGKSDSLKIDRVEYSKCNIDNFDYTYLYEIEKTNEGVQVSKTESIVYNDDKDAEDSKFIKDTFAYSSLLEAIKTNEEDNISKSYDKENKKKKAGDISFQLGYGILGWSNRVSGIDDLFASPKGQYILRYSDSWSFGFRYDAKISKRWTISSGIGYESNIFRFENNVVLTTINGDRRIDFETNNLIDAESKLVARYVTVPLFIKYRVVKNFTLHAGAIAGVNFRTSSTGFKRDYEQQNKEIEERWGTKYDNFKPLKLDVQAGFGWNSVNFYAKYSLIPLFKDNKEIELYPYSVGVSFGL